ncbi:MAG: nicotinate-nucleotide diphosphorylase, partial [Piscirickettsiaceae bacterium]
VRKIANTGVDYVSVGALTKHINAIDLSLRVDIE